MRTDLIRGLQNLKKSLKGEAMKDFSQLEAALLDILHRQRLYPDNESLNLEKENILQKLDVLAQNNGYRNLTAFCAFPTTANSASASHRSTKDEVSLPSLNPIGRVDLSSLFPTSTVELLTRFVPISYCYYQTKDTYPLITLHFDSRHLSNESTANISISFYEYSDPIEHQVTIPAQSQLSVPFLPLIRTKLMQEVTEQCRATLCVNIDYLTPFSWHKPYTETVNLLSRETALLWRCQEDDVLIDCTPYLAAWVTPRHPVIQKLVSQAAHKLSPIGLRGYNVPGNRDEQKRAVREQVQAIFEVLHSAGIIYVSSSEKIQASLERVQKTQLVRLPSEVIKSGGSANCIDGTLLFASLLEHANLHPLLFLKTGHALVGWHVSKDGTESEFLETIKLNTGDFQLAFQEGQEQYQQVRKQKILGKAIAGVSQYAFLIDIAECRRNTITPME